MSKKKDTLDDYKFTSDELETHINQSKAERTDEEKWVVFTNDPYWIRRMEDKGAILIKTLSGNGHIFEIEHRQVTIRTRGKKSRPKGLRKST